MVLGEFFIFLRGSFLRRTEMEQKQGAAFSISVFAQFSYTQSALAGHCLNIY